VAVPQSKRPSAGVFCAKGSWGRPHKGARRNWWGRARRGKKLKEGERTANKYSGRGETDRNYGLGTRHGLGLTRVGPVCKSGEGGRSNQKKAKVAVVSAAGPRARSPADQTLSGGKHSGLSPSEGKPKMWGAGRFHPHTGQLRDLCIVRQSRRREALYYLEKRGKKW